MRVGHYRILFQRWRLSVHGPCPDLTGQLPSHSLNLISPLPESPSGSTCTPRLDSSNSSTFPNKKQQNTEKASERERERKKILKKKVNTYKYHAPCALQLPHFSWKILNIFSGKCASLSSRNRTSSNTHYWIKTKKLRFLAQLSLVGGAVRAVSARFRFGMWKLARLAASSLARSRRFSTVIPGPCMVHKRGADILHDPWFNKVFSLLSSASLAIYRSFFFLIRVRKLCFCF